MRAQSIIINLLREIIFLLGAQDDRLLCYY